MHKGNSSTATLNQKQNHISKVPPELATPSDLPDHIRQKIADELNILVADSFALYVKTKNFHWHLSGSHFRDYHLLFDEQAEKIFATIDPLAERARKLGKTTVRSIGSISKLMTVHDNDQDFVEPEAMLQILLKDNYNSAARMRATWKFCEENKDSATASLLEIFLDEAERRTWFLFEASQR